MATTESLTGQTLRRQAQEMLKSTAPPQLASVAEGNLLLHELRVHQIELEMQNEELRRTQEELEAAKARYFDLYDLAPVGYCTVNEAGLILEANLTITDLLGVARGALVKQPLSRFFLPEDQDTYYHYWHQLRKGGLVQPLEMRMVGPEGRSFWVLLHFSPAPDHKYRLTLSDISERKRADESLRKSDRFIRDILSSVDEAFVVIDRDYQILSANRAYCEQSGEPLANIIGRHCHEISHHTSEPCHGPRHVCDLEHTFETGEPGYTIHTHTDNQGGLRHVEVKTFAMKDEVGVVTSIIEIHNDITGRLALEEQLRQSQKMEVIGTLAGGIAHDFNNILTSILGFAEIVSDGLPPDSPLRRDQAHVIQGGKRAAELVKQILTFSRKAGQQVSPLLIQFIIKEALKLIRASLPTTIEIRESIDVNCDPVIADPTQIHQLLMNLCTNAKQAMNTTGGILSVSLQTVSLTKAEAASLGNLHAGSHLLLEVGDTGCGISKEIQKRIFEPYFTTKETGQGTGLGLAVVHGIVTVMGGAINITSEPDRGATFKVYLPLANKAMGSKEAYPEGTPRGKNESVLVVDDESTIGSLVGQQLESLGYRATVFADSESALQAFTAAPKSFDLLVTDMTMPKLTGAGLAKEILTIRPGMPIILCTGFSETIDQAKAKAQGISAFLLKPIGKDTLARVARRVLDGGE